jgi:hypothetical protein
LSLKPKYLLRLVPTHPHFSVGKWDRPSFPSSFLKSTLFPWHFIGGNLKLLFSSQCRACDSREQMNFTVESKQVCHEVIIRFLDHNSINLSLFIDVPDFFFFLVYRQILIHLLFGLLGSILVGFDVLTPLIMKISLFWDLTLCSPLKVNWCFGGTYL